MSATSPKERLPPPSFVIRKHALAMLQNAPADPLAALEEKYRSKMLQQQHAAAIGFKETTKRSRRIWLFFWGGTGKWQTEFCWVLCQFVSLQAAKWTKSEVVRVAGGFASDVHARYLWRRCWIRLWLAGFLVLTCLILLYLFTCVNSSDFLYEKLLS